MKTFLLLSFRFYFARFLTKNSLFNILLMLKSKLGECDWYFAQCLSSLLFRVDGARSGEMAY